MKKVAKKRAGAAPRRAGGRRRICKGVDAKGRAGASPRRAASGIRRLRGLLVRRQNLMYLTMVGSGAFLLAESARGVVEHIGVATAFILTGGVGFVMSLTTMDVGRSLMTAFAKEGRKTRAVIEAHAERAEARAEARAKRAEAHAERAEARAEARAKRAEAHAEARAEARAERAEARAEDRNTLVLERLDRLAESLEVMSSDNRMFFQRMLETQTKILEKLP